MDAKTRAILEARIQDAIRYAETRGVPKFVGFLDMSGAAIAVVIAEKSRCKFKLYGGYDGAERVYFGVFPDWCEPENETFPIARLKIQNKGIKALAHRDVLGALMSAGIERDTVGDILIGDKISVVFTAQSVASHIKADIVKIASCGVEITEDFDDLELPIAHRFAENSGTVASLRLDCVVAELCNCSRNKACELIETGSVALQGLEVLKVTAEVVAGDTVTVRRFGKFIVDRCDRITKKGRIAIIYRKYI